MADSDFSSYQKISSFGATKAAKICDSTSYRWLIETMNFLVFSVVNLPFSEQI